MMLVQLLMATIINPKTLNISRTLLKNSELQFVPSLLKVRQFNDTLKGLTVFVENKNKNGTYENIFMKDERRILIKNSELQFIPTLLKVKQFNDTLKGLTIFVENKTVNGTYENIFIRDEKGILTNVSSGSSTIFAKSGYATKDGKNLILFNGNVQKVEIDDKLSIITFNKTTINLSGLSTKTTAEPKIQETSTIQITQCMQKRNLSLQNCSKATDIESREQHLRHNKIEFNRRFGMPIFIPLVALISCFLLLTRNEKKISGFYNYIFFFIGFTILVSSEISVRYSGTSLHHAAIYYLIPIGLIPFVYLFLIRTFKYENLS